MLKGSNNSERVRLKVVMDLVFPRQFRTYTVYCREVSSPRIESWGRRGTFSKGGGSFYKLLFVYR